MCSKLCYSWHRQVGGNKCKYSCTIPVTAFRNHILEAKETFECWITVMTLYYTYMFMLVPDESLLRPQFTSRGIEGWLWILKHRIIGENFVAYVSELKQKNTKYIINTILTLSSHLLTISQVFSSPIDI